MINAFLLATVAVVLAEMGDKTQLLAMAFATRFRWQTVLWAVFAATLVNHLMAVAVGNVITQFLPMAWIKLAAAIRASYPKFIVTVTYICVTRKSSSIRFYPIIINAFQLIFKNIFFRRSIIE